jgi:prepilin-type N-terminal cleavage/methylation domain-containing protein/prepilin-type processing-associated H-X9-DG protein
MKSNSKKSRAFTLIELLVVIAVIAVLATIGNAAVQSAMRGASSSAEVSAAKTLTAALQSAVADNNGQYPFALDSQANNVTDAQGKSLGMRQIGHRYPFRLAPYFGFDLDSTLLVGKNKNQMLRVMNLSKPEGPMYNYAISAFPSLGINRHFVGGRRPPRDAPPSPETIRTIAQADRNIIAFASAGTKDVFGYEYVIAPGAPDGSWNSADWGEGADPGSYGNVHPRHNGKAVAAFLDGSVKKLSIDELRDMRLWSRNAAINDDPNYQAQN